VRTIFPLNADSRPNLSKTFVGLDYRRNFTAQRTVLKPTHKRESPMMILKASSIGE
jgi:hypothetical protein